MSHELTLFPVPDPGNSMRVFIVRSTEDGILALQAMLKQRFQDGRAVGRAEAEDAPSADPGPESRLRRVA